MPPLRIYRRLWKRSVPVNVALNTCSLILFVLCNYLFIQDQLNFNGFALKMAIVLSAAGCIHAIVIAAFAAYFVYVKKYRWAAYILLYASLTILLGLGHYYLLFVVLFP